MLLPVYRTARRIFPEGRISIQTAGRPKHFTRACAEYIDTSAFCLGMSEAPVSRLFHLIFEGYIELYLVISDSNRLQSPFTLSDHSASHNVSLSRYMSSRH